jgi:hypothetical protein
MRAGRAALSAILDVEMDLHVKLCGQWGLSPAQIEAAAENGAIAGQLLEDQGVGGFPALIRSPGFFLSLVNYLIELDFSEAWDPRAGGPRPPGGGTPGVPPRTKHINGVPIPARTRAREGRRAGVLPVPPGGAPGPTAVRKNHSGAPTDRRWPWSFARGYEGDAGKRAKTALAPPTRRSPSEARFPTCRLPDAYLLQKREAAVSV